MAAIASLRTRAELEGLGGIDHLLQDRTRLLVLVAHRGLEHVEQLLVARGVGGQRQLGHAADGQRSTLLRSLAHSRIETMRRTGS